MKRYQFLLLDAGPIIKIFELGIWEAFIENCDVTICRIVADEAKWASQEFEDIRIDLDSYEKQDLIDIEDVSLSIVKSFYDILSPQYRDSIHDGEKETLAFLFDSSADWRICSADRAVFCTLGLLGKAEQGISLEEVLKTLGIGPGSIWENITPRDKDWKYTKKFREKWTHKGQMDFIQDRGLQQPFQ